VRFGVEVQKALAFTLAGAGDLRVPILIVHGGADVIVPPASSLRFFERLAVEDKVRIEYPGAYHELDNDYARDDALRDITEWLAARLGAAA
jgi:alpha-beta hydrolase superfamily lysophospholipase